MKRFFRWLRFVAPLVLLIGLIIGIGWWFGVPRVMEVYPLDGAVDMPAGSPLRMRFSRLMDPAQVQERISIQPETAGAFFWDANTLVFTPEEPWQAGTEVRVSVDAGAQPRTFPRLAMPVSRTWRFTVRQPRLAFLHPADGPANVTVRNPITGEDEALTDVPAGVLDFTILEDGSRMVYSAENPQGGSDIYRLDISRRFTSPGGSDPTPAPPQAELLVSCSPAICRGAAISSDGRYLAYERSEPPEPDRQTLSQVWVLALTTRGGAALSSVDAPIGPPQPVSDPTHPASLPAWSADGRLSYFDRTAQAFVVVTPDGEEQARYRNTTGQPGDWQPGGRAFVAPEIFFLDENFSETLQDKLDRLSDSHLMLYEQPGEGRDLTEVEGLEDALPVFSPDGRVLAFARKYLSTEHWTPGRQLWLMDVISRQGRPLTNEDDYNHFDFAWSPDGRQLAYVRFNQRLLTEPPEVWVVNVENDQKTMIVKGGYSPQWIP
jgi:Tol biopolymer transport system component